MTAPAQRESHAARENPADGQSVTSRLAGPGAAIGVAAVLFALLDVSGQSFWQGLVINLAIFIILVVAVFRVGSAIEIDVVFID